MTDTSIPLGKAIEEFLGTAHARQGMRVELMSLARLCGSDCPMFTLTSSDITEFAMEVKKASERRRRVEALVNFFDYAKEKGWVRVNLAAGLVNKKKETKFQKNKMAQKREEPVKLSIEGRRKVEMEIKALLNERERVTAEVAAAREEGDLSENAGYHDARERLALIDAQLREKEDLLARAKPLE